MEFCNKREMLDRFNVGLLILKRLFMDNKFTQEQAEEMILLMMDIRGLQCDHLQLLEEGNRNTKVLVNAVLNSDCSKLTAAEIDSIKNKIEENFRIIQTHYSLIDKVGKMLEETKVYRKN